MRALTPVFLLLSMALSPAAEKSIGWNYHWSTPLEAGSSAGAPGYQQTHWNNHKGIGQAPGKVPFPLHDDKGKPTTAILKVWKQSRNNGWLQKQTDNPDQLLLNNFSNQEPLLVFSKIPYNSYSVVVYYGNNEGPSTSILTVGRKSLKMTTGNTALSSHATKGYLRGTRDNTGSPTNYAIFEGLIGSEIKISLSGANNNGICAVQIVEGDPVPESTTPARPLFPSDGSKGFKPWQFLSWEPGGAGEIGYDLYLWPQSKSRPASPLASTETTRIQPLQYLDPNTGYRWQIVTRLQSGKSLTSPDYTFTTGTLAGVPPFNISPFAQSERAKRVDQSRGLKSLITKTNGSYPLPDQTTLAFYGDSITDVFTYFDDLEKALKEARSKDSSFPEVTVLNRGINGATTNDLLNLPDGDQFPGGTGPNPPLPFRKQIDADLAKLEPGTDYVAIIQIGINDVLQGDNTPIATYQALLESMVDYVLKKGHRVVLASPAAISEIPIADLTGDGRFNDEGNSLLNGYVEALGEIAKSRKVPFVNQRRAYLDIAMNENFAVADDASGTVTFPSSSGILNTDSVHPNSRGKLLSSDLVAGGILQLFQNRR